MQVLKIQREFSDWQDPARGKNPRTQQAESMGFALAAARASYNPPPYKGNALILQSGRPEGRTNPSFLDPWGSLLPYKEIYQGPPGHIKLFDAPYVELAAQRIRTSIDNAVGELSDAALSTR